jgi:putative CocE/NonD family hydrolase
LKKRVAYYVAGPNAEHWRWADSLEAIPTGRLELYLGSVGGRANDVYASGQLSPKPGESAPDGWTYDPLAPPTFDANVTHPAALSFVDQSAVVRAAGNGVIYHTAPFEEETEIAGQLSLTAWISLDVPDTDFQATVYEILPTGKSIQLTTTVLRARYRESVRQEKLVPPGAILPYRFVNFPFFARRIAKGSRLRLFLRSPDGLEFQKNYNGGGVVANESGKDARTAHVKVYHDREHQSVLTVPITRSLVP